MMNKIKTRPFDAANYLNDEEDVAAYLTAVMEEGDPALLAGALGDIARARGMTQLAKDTGLSRESLYRALGDDGNPEFATLLAVLSALGLRLGVSKADAPAV